MIDTDFAALTRVAAESRIGHVVANIVNGLAAARRDSRIAAMAAAARQEVLSWPRHERARAALVIAGVGALGHWALLFVVPPYVAPGISPAVSLGLGLIALGMAAAAPQITKAWQISALARLLKWLVT